MAAAEKGFGRAADPQPARRSRLEQGARRGAADPERLLEIDVLAGRPSNRRCP
jgi:hypothetical protein